MVRQKQFICILLFSMLTIGKTFAQKDDKTGVSNITKLNFLLPGVSLEQKFSKFKTIYIFAYLDFFLVKTNSYYGSKSHLNVAPSLDLEFRNYYNFKTRMKNNLRTEMNSLNYIAPVYTASYVNSPPNSNKMKLIQQFGAVWGIQRNYPRRFSLDLNVGLGYLFNATSYSNNNSIWPIAQFTLGVWLNKKVPKS